MVPIGVLEDLRGHAQEPGAFSNRYAALHREISSRRHFMFELFDQKNVARSLDSSSDVLTANEQGREPVSDQRLDAIYHDARRLVWDDARFYE